MQKFIILIIAILVNLSSFAQNRTDVHPTSATIINAHNYTVLGSNPMERTTAIGDTEILYNIVDTATLALYTLGGSNYGYVTGTDSNSDQGFAERYDFQGVDSSVTVIGVFALFGGTVNPASTKTVTFKAWTQGDPVVITDSFAYSGFPGSILDTLAVPITQLGIGVHSDTIKEFLFPYATPVLWGSFFVGYSIMYNYDSLNGDTIGLYSSLNGDRRTPVIAATVTSTSDTGLVETIINVQNATQWSDNNWYDNYTQDDSLYNDLAIYPIVVIGAGNEGVAGITKNNFTFFGNYPNPSINSTNIKFALAKSMDVTIQITDMQGRTINTIQQKNLSTGEHIIPVNTSNMPSGDYLYLIHTSAGSGMGGKMTVVR